MDELYYMRTVVEKLMLYASPKKLEAMLEDLHALWEGHRQEGCSEKEIFERLGTPTLLLEHTRHEGRFRFLLVVMMGSMALVLSMVLFYTTLYVSAWWILPTAFFLLLLGLWLLAGGTGMELLTCLTRAYPRRLLPYSIPFFSALFPVATCLLCLHYQINLLQPERIGNICTTILRLCILTMMGQTIWCFFKTRHMGGGYFFLLIQAVGSAFSSLSLLRYLTWMDSPDGLVYGSNQQMLLLDFLRVSLPYYLVGLLLSLLLFAGIYMTERKGKPWISN